MINIKNNDRFIISSQGDMGFELPASIGCQIANPDKKLIIKSIAKYIKKYLFYKEG